MPFPAERLPDGVILTTHHFTYAMLFAFLGLLVVWDNYRRREPVITAIAILAALVGFVLAWRFHPVTGAVLALVGSTLGIVLPLTTQWRGYPRKWRLWVVGWSAVALDDAISHAFGVWTPLDWMYNAGAYVLFP